MHRTHLNRFVLGLLVSVLIVAGFTIVTAAQEPFVDCGKIVMRTFQEINTMDPAEAFVCYSLQATRMAYEPLLQYNLKDFSIEPVLAESWEVDEDGGTFHLRKGVKFHDGTDFNAEAVRFSWKRIMAINKAPATWLKDVKDVKAVDDHTVRIETEKNWAFLLDVLASEKIFMMVSPTAVKKHATNDDPWAAKWCHGNTCGTGPYMVKEWVPNQYISLVRNKDYWNGWAGKHFSEALLRLITEHGTARMVIKKGEVDLLTQMPPEYWDPLDAEPDLTTRVIPSFSQYMVMLNNARGPCTDKNLRWAISYCMDYEAFRISMKVPPGPGLIGSVNEIDLDKAREYLNKSAYAGKGLDLQLNIPTGGVPHKRIGLILQDNLKKIGINATLRTIPWPAFANEIYGDPKKAQDMYVLYVSSIIPDPYGMLYKIHHSNSNEPGGGNLGYSNPRFDALLDQARTTIDREKRMALYKEAKKVAEGDAPFVYCSRLPYIVIHRDNIKVHPYTKLGDALNQMIYFYDMYRE